MNARQEGLHLPEGAGELLEAAYRIGDELLGARKWAVGGGSVLAARWRHRLSTDLDVFVSRIRFLRMQRRHTGKSLAERIREGLHPYRVNEFAGDPNVFIKAQDVTLDGVPKGDIDIVGADRVLPSRARKEYVAGTDVEALPTDEILAGKVASRGTRLLARDVYDLAVAHRRDPHAFRRAVEAAFGPTIGIMLHLIEEHEHTWNPTPGESRIIDPTDEEAFGEAPAIVHAAITRIAERRNGRIEHGGDEW